MPRHRPGPHAPRPLRRATGQGGVVDGHRGRVQPAGATDRAAGWLIRYLSVWMNLPFVVQSFSARQNA
jgi:hypothetical protein